MPTGLRAKEPSEFELPQATVFRCAPDGAELVCLRTPDLLARQPDARIGIAPDVELLVHDGTLTGWRLVDPARCFTSGFSTPDTDSPPSPTTRRHLAAISPSACVLSPRPSSTPSWSGTLTHGATCSHSSVPCATSTTTGVARMSCKL
ncbi:hypothetical protein ACFWVU_25300 [Streptomyces sp. NPDC058686]|uniref:hypothetical protein n=1 Tax=Streptomyces sp. NPDC058686 TaxID=3346599 RepID=UPI00364DADF6